MKPKLIILFGLFTLLFLFYPGDSYYYHIFAYNRELFEKKQTEISLDIKPIPVLKEQYYPEVTAEGVYVVDLPSFTPIFQKNAHKKFLPASTNKIITALVAFDVYKPEEIITVKKVNQNGQTMGLFPGEKITVENLLYGILVHSGNDAAFALAEDYGYERFIELMNQKAKSLGMKDSFFTNPAGLDDWKNYTTPFDLALAARELLNNRYLTKIAATKEIVISDTDYKYFHTLVNVNKLLGEVQGIGGLKTGYTENAKENLVSFYKNNDHQFLIVVMKSENRFQDTVSIVQWINNNIDYIIFSSGK
ncbi:MAG: serine hydrolase [Microgenomates group bacterium]|nr:serine hydrolase [Microgenomates group bacterium]